MPEYESKTAKRRYIALLTALPLCGVFFTVLLPFFTHGRTICIFYRLTGLPCPGCGLSRAAALLLKGDFMGAVYTNPMILPVGIYALILWTAALIGFVRGEDKWVSALLSPRLNKRQKTIFICLATLAVLANWAFSLYKYSLGVL